MMQRICFTKYEKALNFNESFSALGNLLKSDSEPRLEFDNPPRMDANEASDLE